LLLLASCAELSVPLQQPVVTVRTPVQTSTGTLVTNLENARWVSEIEGGRIVRIREEFVFPGMTIGWRLLDFDSLGRLTHFTEHAYDSRDRTALQHAAHLRTVGITVDSVSNATTRDERLTVVQFLAETPMLAARRLYGRAAPMSRIELHRIVAHAADLYERATTAGAESAR
jgi:hypothetical protein